MTNFFAPQGAASAQTAGNGAGEPGAAPVGSSMQGNPQASQFQPNGVNLPAPQLTPATAILRPTQFSNGNIPLHAQPSTVGAAPTAGAGAGSGNDSLLALMSRGQVLLAGSTYGQSGFIPANGGSSPQAGQDTQNSVQTGAAIAYAVPPTYTGN